MAKSQLETCGYTDDVNTPIVEPVPWRKTLCDQVSAEIVTGFDIQKHETPFCKFKDNAVIHVAVVDIKK